jgi:hypothetical protein
LAAPQTPDMSAYVLFIHYKVTMPDRGVANASHVAFLTERGCDRCPTCLKPSDPRRQDWKREGMPPRSSIGKRIVRRPASYEEEPDTDDGKHFA